MIPFIDLPRQHKALEKELLAVFRESLRTASFIGGAQVASFEKEFAEFCEAKYCIGVSNGTDALRLALVAAGVKHGDGVITVPNTFIATTEAISQSGAKPIFVDVDEATCNMDPNQLEDYLQRCFTSDVSHFTYRPKAVIPVHLYGQPVDMDTILEIAGRYDLLVIEDACQAHGAEYFSSKENSWKRAGSMGRAAAFSFYPGKNLGACGDAGAVTTNDGDIAEKIRILRDHGQSQKYHHDIEGYNNRLDAIQAGFLRVKLKKLNEWNEARRKNARVYYNLLKNIDGVRVVEQAEFARSVHHLYVIFVENRDGMQKFLAERGISTGFHYPLPLHFQKAYRHLGYSKGDFPVAEKLAEQLISLPLYPELTEDQITYVVDCIREYVAKNN